VDPGRIEANALSCVLDVEQSPQRLGDLIEDIIAQGDSAGGPWQGGVYAGRRLRYEPVPTQALYIWHNGTLQAIGGGEITAELIEPGCLIRNTTGLAAWRPIGQKQVWDDPLLAYVEAVEFSQREGLKLSLAKRSAEALTKQNSQSSQQLRTLTPLWVGHAEGPRAGMLQYGDDNGDPVYAWEVVGPDNVPCAGISATDNGDPDAVQGGIGYETYPRIHFETVTGYARKLPVVDLPLLAGAGAAAVGTVPTADGAGGVAWAPAGAGGVTDHGNLTGLADDDHAQYHTDGRGDARYSGLAHTHAGSGGLVQILAADPGAPETGEMWLLKTPITAGGGLSGLLLALTSTNIIGYVRQLSIYDGAPYRVTLEAD
jgi:hypothetical protein